MNCTVDGCEGKVHGNSLCKRHYLRNYRHGSPTAGGTDKKAALKMLEFLKSYDGDDCIKWPYATVNGYGQVRINGSTKLVTRILCEADNGPDPSGSHHAAHSCGNGHLGCSNRKHLRWATYQENRQDMIDHGKSQRGEKCYFSTLRKEQVLEIKSLLGSKSQRKIADDFGVTKGAVNAIATGKSWAWLEKEE